MRYVNTRTLFSFGVGVIAVVAFGLGQLVNLEYGVVLGAIVALVVGIVAYEGFLLLIALVADATLKRRS